MFRFLCDAVRRMGRDERGNVFVLFGAAAIPLLLIMGGAIDLARFTRYKAELANTVDAAALALARDHFSYTAAQAKDFVNDYVNAHGITDDKFGITSISVTKLSNGFRVTTDANMKTIFLPLTGFTAGGKPISGMAMDIVSEVATESKRLEVAIVLDNSGSMAGTKLSTLKDAATSLVSMLYRPRRRKLAHRSSQDRPRALRGVRQRRVHVCVCLVDGYRCEGYLSRGRDGG